MKCLFGVDLVESNVSTDFRWFFHSYYGNCYIFNSGKNLNGDQVSIKSSYKAAQYDALQLELYVGESNNLEEFTTNLGFQFIIANHSDSFNVLDSIDVSTGFETNIVIDRTSFKQMPKPYSDCLLNQNNVGIYDSKLTKEFALLNLNYRQSQCVDLCYQQLSIQNCNCTDFILDEQFEEKMCITLEEITCLYEFYDNIFSKGDFIRDNCFSLCPLECDHIKLQKTMSFSRYPSNSYFELLKKDSQLKERVFKNANWDYVRSSILKVNIYYENLAYLSITENASMTVIDLLSKIGGKTC